MTETRLFFMVDSLDDNEEIFETLEQANAYYLTLSPTRKLDDIGTDNKRRICVVCTENAYRENNGWNYDDTANTFEILYVLDAPVTEYVIVNKRTKDYWNNNLGWCEDRQLAELFTDKDLDLPLDGEWQKA